MPPEDAELLHAYAADGSEAAFAELVRRRLGLVYSVALRKCGGRADLAADVAQQVFIVAARNAARLATHPAFVAWLYTAARRAAVNMQRGEWRRARRDTEAMGRRAMESDPGPAPDWGALAPALEDALAEISEEERRAVLLRYYDGRDWAGVARVLRLRDDAARKRVERAVGRLRQALSRRGIASTAAALELALAAQGAVAAPAGMAAAVTSAVAAATAAGAGVGSFAALVQLMSVSKISLGGAAAVILLGAAMVGGVGYAVSGYRADRAARAELAAARERYAQTTQSRAAPRMANSAAAANRLSAQSVQPPAGDARELARSFLQTDPAFAHQMTEAAKSRFARVYGAFLAQAQLTPAQIEAFESRSAEYCMDHLLLTPSGLIMGESSLPPDQVREILGEAAMPAYQDFNRGMGAREFAQEMAVAEESSGQPLSAAQASAITQSVLDLSPQYQSGQSVVLGNVDLKAVLGTPAGALSLAQQEVGTDVVAHYQYNGILWKTLEKMGVNR